MGSLSTSRYPFRGRFLETRDIPQPRCPQMSSSPSPRTDKIADGNSHNRQHRGRTGLHPGAYSRAWQGVGYGNSPSRCTITGSGRFRLFHAFGERSRQSWRSESARAPRAAPYRDFSTQFEVEKLERFGNQQSSVSEATLDLCPKSRAAPLIAGRAVLTGQGRDQLGVLTFHRLRIHSTT